MSRNWVALLILVGCGEFVNFRFERSGPQQCSIAFGLKANEFSSNILICLVRALKLGVQQDGAAKLGTPQVGTLKLGTPQVGMLKPGLH